MSKTKSIMIFISTLFCVTLITVVFIFFIYTHIAKSQNNNQLKPNQVWRYIINKNNPFEQPIIFDNKIIDLKNGYVQYVIINRNLDLDTLSSKESTFRFDSKCIENCE